MVNKHTSSDELRKKIGAALQFWRKKELADIYYPLDEIMNELEAYIKTEMLKARIDELKKIAEQYGEFRDETTGKPITFKGVALYRVKHRLNTLESLNLEGVQE